MTTKTEFDSFIAGFKLAGHEHISTDQLDAILAKVDDLVAGLTAPATDDAATTVALDTADTATATEETATVDTADGAAAIAPDPATSDATASADASAVPTA